MVKVVRLKKKELNCTERGERKAPTMSLCTVQCP